MHKGGNIKQFIATYDNIQPFQLNYYILPFQLWPLFKISRKGYSIKINDLFLSTILLPCSRNNKNSVIEDI